MNLKFSDIPVNRDEIPQGELNIDIKTRSNLFTWNGQFSPQFVEIILSKYAKQDYVVVDPFVGSGTVLIECARKKISAYGIELNASAYFMAKTYELCLLGRDKRKSILSSVDNVINKAIGSDDSFGNIVHAIKNNCSEFEKNILSILVILIDIYKKDFSNALILSKWKQLSDIIYSLPYTENKITAENGDARHMNMPNASADMLLTSPPYINVFNYHQKYRASVERLGYDVLDIAKSEFGSNRKNRGNRILTVIQYCIDIALSIREACRVCKPEARMIYVVGRESTILGYSFCNSELVYNIGVEIFDLKFILRQERVFKNRFGQMIYEDIIHFKNSNKNIDVFDIISKARKIAMDMIASKLMIKNTNNNLLKIAIDKADMVNASEVRCA